MPNPAQATPEMVNKVGGLEEVELNPQTGETRPLSSQNPADPSPQASQVGAAAEPAGSQPEPQSPSTAQTPAAPAGEPQAPAQTVVEPTPVVEVVPPTTQQPAPAPAAVETAPSAPATTPEDEAAALGRLGTFLEEKRVEIVQEAQRSAQSQSDKRSAQFDRQMQESNVRSQELTNQIRELQNRDLTPAEQEVARAKFAQDDERAKLDSDRTELIGFQKTLMVDSLVLEYVQFGVARDAIEAIESPEEMELYCEQQKSAFLEKKLSEGQAPVEPAPAPAVPTETVAQPAATAAPEPQPQPNAGVPAGASASSDIGAGGTVDEGTKFSEERSADAMKQNLRNMGWDSVRVRQA